LNSIDINDDNDTRNDSNNDVWPEARHNHAGVALGDDSVLIFGGSGEHGFLDDLWLLNVTDASGEISIRWRRVVKSDPWPAARHGHAWCTVVRDTRTFVVLQGGHSGRQSQGATYHGDLWVFDPQLERFHQVEGPLQQRAQRSWHSMVSLGQHLLLAYGYTFRERSEVYFGDAWLIELELAGDGSWRTHWRLLDVSGDTSVMTARNRVAMCVLADGTSVFVYGGNEFDGRRDEFFDLPSVLTVDAAAGRARAVLLRPSEADAASLKLGHAVAIRVPMSDAVLVCGGERSRQRLDSMLCILIHQ
jgi:hypothetical protein